MRANSLFLKLKRTLSGGAGFITILLLIVSSSRGDDFLGSGWQISGTISLLPLLNSGTASPTTLSASSPVMQPLSLVSGPSPTAITPELQTLATGLNNDPLKIFNYVHNKIEFQPYWGSNKGAHTTYLDGAGNDFDQSSLLIALLKAAGYTNNSYVYGTYSVPDVSGNGNDLAHWVGATSGWLAIYTLGYGGVPIISGNGQVTYNLWTFDHVWVRAVINGTSYDLDPSCKMSNLYIGADLKTNSGYNRSDLLTAAGGVSTGDYVQSISRSGVENKLRDYAGNLRNYFKANYPNFDSVQLYGGHVINEQAFTSLSQGAPPAAFSPTSSGVSPYLTFASIGSAYQATLRVQVGTQIDATFNLDGLQANRLSVTFSGANAQLWNGDTLVAQETNGTGATASVTLSMTQPGDQGATGGLHFNQTLSAVSYLRTGSYDLTYAVHPNAKSNGQIDASNRRLQNYLASGLTDSSRQVLTETLHGLGIKWVRRVALVENLTANLFGVGSQLSHIMGRTGQETSYYVDMPGLVANDFDASGNLIADAFNSASFVESAMEHGVIEQSGCSPGSNASLSTVKCLVLANDGGQKIFKATSANYGTGFNVSNQLASYTGTQKSNFTSLTNSGHTLLLHQNGLTGLNQWTGSGYADFNTNFAGMVIGGLYSGGYNSTYASVYGTYTTETTQNSSNFASTTSYGNPPVTGADPVNVLTGAYTMVNTDLTLGVENSPRGLNFTRYYDGTRNFQASSLGNGWQHSCEGKITLSSELDASFGLRQAVDAAQTIVGMMAVNDFADSSYTPKELMVGTIAANWTVNRITNNCANVQLGNQLSTYTSLPDSSWNPPPGSTTALTGSGGAFVLQPRFGGSISFDGSNRVSQWVDVDNNTETWSYNPNGTLDTVVDKHFRSLKFNYYTSGVGSGLLQNVTDSTGRSVQFAYTSGSYSGANLTTVTDPQGYQKTFVYDGRNRLTDLKDNALASITHNDYDSLDRVYQQLSQNISNHKWQFLYSPGITLEIDPQGGTTTHLFDSKNRNAGTIDALGNTTSFGYDSQNHVTLSVDATGRQTTAIYDGNQNPSTISITGTDGSVKTTTYYFDGSLRLWKVYDPTGRYTENGYDSKNHLTSTWDAGRRLTQYFYRIDGLVDHVIDPAGNTTSYTAYDSHGNPTNVTRGDGTTTSATFNVFGDPLTSTDGRGKTTTFTYDNRRLPSTRLDALGKTTTWVYDSNGYLQSVTDRNNHTVSSSYNNLGHLQSKSATDTAAVTYGYDTRDWQTTATDGLGHATTNNFDAAGRQISTVNALAITTGSTVYDSAGRLSVQYDGLNHATHYFYDGAGRLDHSVDPINHTVYNSYDDAGRALTLQNRRGLTFGFGYSTDGLSSTFTYPSGRQSQIAAREAGGLPQTVHSPSGNQTTLTYDGAKRTKTQTDGVGSITWIYDGEGNATDVVETSGSTHRVFDELGRVKICTDIQGNTVGYGYDNEGNITSIVYPGGKTVTYTYDGSNRLKTVTDWASRVTTYNYDVAGRLQTVVRPNSTRQRVIFDNANRLSNSYEEQLSGGTVIATLWQAGYGFDNANRLTSFTPTPSGKTFAPPVTTMTYDADNRIATYNGQTVNNDQDGNMLTAPVNGTLLAAMTYDKRNRLTSAGGITYAYDAENRRISSTTGGQTTRYIYSRGGSLDRLLAKLNPDGSITRYIYGTGLLYEETTSASGSASPAVYYHFDWRGDTVALSDPNGNVTARLSYSPYGERTIESGTVTTLFCFNGKWGVITEPSGLLYMQARYYSPVLRRFLNEDPSGFNGGSNMHAYGGDPVNSNDPTGLTTLVLWGEDYLHGNKGFFQQHAEAWAANSGIKDTAVMRGQSTEDWNKAITSVSSVDAIVYIGHSGALSGPTKLREGVDVNQVIQPNFSPDATITLYGCNTGVISPGDTTNSATTYTDHFQVPTVGTTTGLSMGMFGGLISPGFMRQADSLWTPVPTVTYQPTYQPTNSSSNK